MISECGGGLPRNSHPSGRDYQTYADDQAYKVARSEWVQHAVPLQNTPRYLEELMEAIVDGESF